MAKLDNGKLSKFRPLQANPNKHTQRGLGLLQQSMQEDGWVAPITVAADGESLDGAARMEVAADKFGDDVIVVEHDGTKPIVMVRTDIANAEVPIAKRIAYRANRVAQVDLAWDAAQIAADMEAGLDLTGMFYDNELAEVLGQEADANQDTVYTRKVNPPIYKPVREKPAVADLYDSVKTTQMIESIKSADYLTDDERAFLVAAAQRHTVFNYAKIADYYAHSTAQVQRLMEDSALVIIDLNRAIELGFASLTEIISEQYADEYGE